MVLLKHILEAEKLSLQTQIKELEVKQKRTVITEDTLRQLFATFKDYVTSRNSRNKETHQSLC